MSDARTPEERLAAIEAVWAPFWNQIAELDGGDRIEAIQAVTWARIRMLEADPEAQALAVTRWEAEESARLAAREDHKRRVEHVGLPVDPRFGHPIDPTLQIGPDPVTKYPELAIGERWQGYTIEGFGISVDALPAPGEKWPYWFVELPRDGRPTWMAESLGDRPGVVYQLWQQIIRVPGTPVYLEVLWHPERGRRMGFMGVELARTLRDVERALPALKLTTILEHRGGRPPGRTYSAAEWPAALDTARVRAAEECRARHRRAFGGDGADAAEATPKDVAKALGISERSYYRHQEDFGSANNPTPDS